MVLIKNQRFIKMKKAIFNFENYTSMIKRYNDLKSQGVDTLKNHVHKIRFN